MTAPRPNKWPTPMLERVLTLWAEGKTALQCAEIINKEFRTRVSRHAVIGQVHRGGGAARPSPIKPARRPRKATGVSVTKTVAQRPAPAQAAENRPAVPTRPGSECLWTDSTAAPWVFCGATCQHGSSYCPEHHRRVWVHKDVKYVVKTAAKRQAAEGSW